VSTNPSLFEQLASDRRKDWAQAARNHRRRLSPAEGRGPSAHRTRPAFARHVGILLISVGRRLADVDPFPAFDTPNHQS